MVEQKELNQYYTDVSQDGVVVPSKYFKKEVYNNFEDKYKINDFKNYKNNDQSFDQITTITPHNVLKYLNLKN